MDQSHTQKRIRGDDERGSLDALKGVFVTGVLDRFRLC